MSAGLSGRAAALAGAAVPLSGADGTARPESPGALRRRADEIESRICTGIAASWCPVHGDCTCPRADGGEPLDGLDANGCPLHDFASSHGAAGLTDLIAPFRELT